MADSNKKKIVVLIPDGMADKPIPELGGKTPMEAADTPCMDSVARAGFCGLTHNVPPGMEPGSDVAIMSIMGFDPKTCYTGRGPIEALSMGVSIPAGESAFRCNLISVDNGQLIDYSGGHIETEDSAEIIASLKDEFDAGGITFHHGVSFRNLLLLEGDFSQTRTFAPHDHMNEPWEKYLPQGPGSEKIIDLIHKSRPILENHPVNRRRAGEGHAPANMIWPWSGGALPETDSYSKKYGISGAVISAVDLVQGLGVLAGIEVIKVPGATGMVDTNYEGKTAAALDAMDKYDFVLVHYEGTDESAHMGDIGLKMEGIRRFDAEIATPICERLKQFDDYLLIILPDHPTPIEIRTHTSDPVPFTALSTGIGVKSGVSAFSEKLAASTGIVFKNGHELLGSLIENRLP
ncbi:MAG TPA: cofactor-independent phosphoglycerate mutase [bacterium]|nr:cofactor-independent phosphoglycerate mutase [bacterium]